MKFKASQFWGEKCPPKNSKDCIATMLGPATYYLYTKLVPAWISIKSDGQFVPVPAIIHLCV